MKRAVVLLATLLPLTAIGDSPSQGTAWVNESANGVMAIQLLNDRDCAFAAVEKPKGRSLMAECTYATDERTLFIRFPVAISPKIPQVLELAYDARSDTVSLPNGRTFRRTTKSEAQDLLGGR